MLLGTDRHSARPAAIAGDTKLGKASSAASAVTALFIPQRLDRIETGGARGGINSGRQTYRDRKDDRSGDHPPRNGCNADRGKIASLEIDVRPEINSVADQPADADTKNASKRSHRASFHEEKSANVTVGSTQGFEDSDFASAFQDGHHQSVHYSERGHHQS